MWWLTISHKYGKDENGLMKALEEGLFSITPNLEGTWGVALLNDGVTCFMKRLDRQLPKRISNWIFERLS